MANPRLEIRASHGYTDTDSTLDTNRAAIVDVSGTWLNGDTAQIFIANTEVNGRNLDFGNKTVDLVLSADRTTDQVASDISALFDAYPEFISSVTGSRVYLGPANSQAKAQIARAINPRVSLNRHE